MKTSSVITCESCKTLVLGVWRGRIPPFCPNCRKPFSEKIDVLALVHQRLFIGDKSDYEPKKPKEDPNQPYLPGFEPRPSENA